MRGEKIVIEGLEAEVLNVSRAGGEEHRVLKLVIEGESAIAKIYGLKRNTVRTLLWQIGHRVLAGKSSIFARSRWATEREVLALWRANGFDVPRLLELELPASFPRPYLLLEWIDGPSMEELLRDEELALGEKEALLMRFVEVWGRRHERALELGEPRLIHEHPTFAHVLVKDDRLVHFDFEVAYTKRRPVGRLVSFEILGFLRSLAKCDPWDYQVLLERVLETYPVRFRLETTVRDLSVGRHATHRLFLALDRLRRARRRPYNKYVILQSLGDALRGKPVSIPIPPREESLGEERL
ncbi:MAG: hypothetical protein AB1486_14060 [Planctomycetota bacterium]